MPSDTNESDVLRALYSGVTLVDWRTPRVSFMVCGVVYTRTYTRYDGMWNYCCFICHPTIAGDSTNILLNFTLHDANAIDTYIYTLRRLLSVPIKCVL